MDDIKVSIVCNAYNHENFIEDAIKGFLMQKTNFKFEILIHDDASTDKTADIIRKYEEMYPDIIKPIYQKENQFSKKVKISPTFQFPRAKGKYIAICEGDDYWTDEFKLQKQFDALEENPQLDICTHKVLILNNGKKIGYIAPKNKKSIIPLESVIMGGGGFVGTCSIMIKTDIITKNTPVKDFISLDYFWQIDGSVRGGMLYLPDSMGIYRIMTENSWTSKMNKEPEKHIEFSKKVIQALRLLNEFLDFRYANCIEEKIKKNEIEILMLENNCRKIFIPRLFKTFLKLPLKQKIKILIKALVNR